MALKRGKLKKTQFGLPGQRKYPMPDRKHAVNAKGRAKQQLKRRKLSRSQYDKIVAKADRVIRAARKASKRGRKVAKSKKK